MIGFDAPVLAAGDGAMDRRGFLKSSGAAAAAVAASGTAVADSAPAAPAVSKGLKELRLAVSYSDSVAGPADWAHRLARSVAELSGGRCRLVPTFGLKDASAAVRAGDADLCFDNVNALLNVHPGFAYFAGLPGDHGLAARDLQTWIAVGGGEALWDDLAGQVGLKPLLAAHTGSQPLMLATGRIESMHGLAGHKIHVDGLARDVARGLGLNVVAVPSGQLASAMQRGEVHIVECGGAIVSYALGLPSVAPYSAGASLNRNGTAMFLGVGRSLWDSLGAGERALLAHAASGEYQMSLAEEEAHRHLLYPAPRAERAWPIAAELEYAVQRVAAAVVAHAAGTDYRSRRIADSYTAYRRAALGGAASV